MTDRAGHPDLARARLEDYLIDLIALQPYPVSTETIALEDYVITLVVGGTEE